MLVEDITQELRVNPDWKNLPLFDRNGWKRVRFGDVVRNVNSTEKNPLEAGIERFIGLEHLEPGSLHVKTWGNVAEGTTFTRLCKPGQVLFGKRRAYQRKVAVADFDAVVSGDIYVFEPKGEELLPELLPFICISHRFFEHAVGTSSGSLSPRTNWTSIASFEFDLPPLEKQRRITKVLRNITDVIIAEEELAQSLEVLHLTKLVHHFDNVRSNCLSYSLDQIARVERGRFSHRPRNLPEFYGGKFPFVQTGDIQNADRFLQSFDYHLTQAGAAQSKLFPEGTIFISIAAVIGATAIAKQEVYATDSVVGVIPTSNIDVDYLELFLKSKRHYLENQIATQTAQKNINLQILRPLKVPCPLIDVQKKIAQEILEPLLLAKASIKHARSTTLIIHSILNQVFRASESSKIHVLQDAYRVH